MNAISNPLFMRSQWGAASPWDVSLSSISAALAVMCLALAYAALIYWLTERHTQLVRRWVLARLPMVKTSRTTPRTSVAAATASPSSKFSN